MNFYAKHNPKLVQGSCAAFDRAEAARCDHFKAGRDGWCIHTLKDYVYEETVPAEQPWMKPTTRTRTAKDMVTGECFSVEAKEGKQNP